ncbi:hypothetical protein MMC07_006571 [Pseudocyphellaria aurata]|nr:hypothetical protein [Pseudocyphellaria aurata]
MKLYSTLGAFSRANTATESQAAQLDFLSPVVHQILQRHVLPRLGAYDLARLAASCTALRELVMGADAHTWQQAAQTALPWQPPMPASIPAIQTALHAHHTCIRNISQGRSSPPTRRTIALQSCVDKVMQAPNGQHIAYMTSRVDEDGEVWLVHLDSAQQQQQQQQRVAQEQGLNPASICWQRSTGHLRVLLSNDLRYRMCTYDGHGRQLESSVIPVGGGLVIRVGESYNGTSCYWAETRFMLLLAQQDPAEGLPYPTPSMTASFSADASLIVLCAYTEAGDGVVLFYHSDSGLPLMKIDSDPALPASWVTYTIKQADACSPTTLSWWLPDDTTFLVPVPPEAPGTVLALGVLSLLDGSCRPLACTMSLAQQQLLNAYDMSFSPDGGYAAVVLGRHGDMQDIALVNLQDQSLIWSLSQQEDVLKLLSKQKCAWLSQPPLMQWSPSSRWLAVCWAAEIDLVRPLLFVLDTRRMAGQLAKCVYQAQLSFCIPHYPRKGCWFYTYHRWQLRWTCTGNSLRVSGVLKDCDEEDYDWTDCVAYLATASVDFERVLE